MTREPDPALDEDWSDMMHRAMARELPKTESRKETPHTRLKRACRVALKLYGDQIGSRGVLVPIQNLRVRIPGTARTYQTGRPGASDDIVLMKGIALALEYKAGRDTQSDRQREFQRKWEAAGGVYIVCREPEQMIAAISVWVK